MKSFLVMSGRSHRFLGVNQYSGDLMCLARRPSTLPSVGIDPGPLDSEFDALPLYAIALLCAHLL